MREPGAEADLVKQPFRALASAVAQRGVVVRKRRHQNIFQHGALRQEVMRLENETDLTVTHRGDLDIIDPAQILAVEQHLAAGGSVECADNVQQRALARTGRPDDGDRFGAPDFHRDVPQNRNRLRARGRFVTLAHLSQSQQCRWHDAVLDENGERVVEKFEHLFNVTGSVPGWTGRKPVLASLRPPLCLHFKSRQCSVRDSRHRHAQGERNFKCLFQSLHNA